MKRVWGAGTGWLADWKRWDFSWRLKVDNLSTERMCAGSGFQVDDAETENARELKLLVMPRDPTRWFVLEARKALDGWVIGSDR